VNEEVEVVAASFSVQCNLSCSSSSSIVEKGPAAEAMDAPQRYGLLRTHVMKMERKSISPPPPHFHFSK
jgi:hypothetical protein